MSPLCLHPLFAIFRTTFDYDLVLQPDCVTHMHMQHTYTQWYFFQVRGMVQGARYTFNIINFVKGESLYNSGMSPVV